MLRTQGDYWHLKFWRIPQLDYLGLMHGSRITYDYPLHLHEEYSIALMLSGRETTICRGRAVAATPGAILLINAEEAHSSHSNQTEYRIFKVRSKALLDLATTIYGTANRRLFTHLVVHDTFVFRRLLDLHIKLEQTASTLECESEFVSTMAVLLARHTGANLAVLPAKRDLRCVRQMRDYIRSHYAENVSLRKLTSVTNLSAFHLLRTFSKEVGCPPHEYLTQVRITQARKLIRNGCALMDVALETGFVDQSHFSRNFKRIVGIPPGQYSRSKIIQDRVGDVW